jgi:hypothetical protein
MSNYPESLVDRCEKLENENKVLREAIQNLGVNQDKYVKNLRLELATAKEYIHRSEEEARVWFWQGDGYDYLRSMASDTPVVITAHELRLLIENGETVAEENGSAPITAKK